MHKNHAIQDADQSFKFPSLGEVLIQVFDYVAKHKSSHSEASDLWDFIRTIIPPESNMETYASIKNILKTHRLETMVVLPVCVNMCVAFVDAVSPQLSGPEFQNSEATVCPVCNEPKYLADGTSPRRVFYHLPFKFWLQDLFMRSDLADYLANNISPLLFPNGHVRRSEGYRQKVTENVKMNRDQRNQAVSLSADGMPYFKDQNAMSGWVISLVNECLAEGNMGHNAAFMHLLGLVPSEYRTQEGSTVKNTKKEPKSLRPAFVLVIDELLLAYHYGLPMEDGSLAKDAHRRKFRCDHSLSV
jgi:hypothetical protein